MSEQGIDAYRVLSVLGYCLLPMVGVGALSVIITLECVILLSIFRLSDVQFPVACWVTCFRPCLLSGVHMPRLVSSLLFYACPISDFWSHTPSAFSTVVLHC
jgi:hypothetical protein